MYLYPRHGGVAGDGSRSEPDTASANLASRPPITLLVVAVGSNIIFDPSRQELSVADLVVAVSVCGEMADDGVRSRSRPSATTSRHRRRTLKLASIRTIDPPSASTAPGLPNALNPTTTTTTSGASSSGATSSPSTNAPPPHQRLPGQSNPRRPQQLQRLVSTATDDRVEGVWRPRRGGFKRDTIAQITKLVLAPGGVADEVLDGLEAVDVG